MSPSPRRRTGLGTAVGIVLRAFLERRRGREVSLVPLAVIGVAYLALGAAAYVLRRFNPHFLFFVGTGVLLLVAARRGSTASSA